MLRWFAGIMAILLGVLLIAVKVAYVAMTQRFDPRLLGGLAMIWACFHFGMQWYSEGRESAAAELGWLRSKLNFAPARKKKPKKKKRPLREYPDADE